MSAHVVIQELLPLTASFFFSKKRDIFFLCQVIVIPVVQFPSTDRLLDRLQLTRNIHFENCVFQREQIPKFKQDIAASQNRS